MHDYLIFTAGYATLGKNNVKKQPEDLSNIGLNHYSSKKGQNHAEGLGY
jgi:hypothetical protein